MKKGEKKGGRGYATVAGEEGVNYREIADTMTELGFPMNHSSARNYVLRVMRKFVDAFVREYDLKLINRTVDDIAKSPRFQYGIADLLQVVETERRSQRDILSGK